MPESNSQLEAPHQTEASKQFVRSLIITFLCPTILGKILVIYFGMNYSAEPGKGYGIGLVLSIAFTLTMFGRFIWRYRNYDD